MSSNSSKIKNSLVLNPISYPISPERGEIYYDKLADSIKYYNGSSWISVGAINVDNTTIEMISDTLRVKDLGIGTAKIAAGAVTAAKRAALTYTLSSSSGTSQNNSGTFAQVTNMSISITTSGRPVIVCLVPDGTSNSTGVYMTNGTEEGELRFRRGSTVLVVYHIVTADIGLGERIHPGCFYYFDTPAAGTYTYDVYHRVSNGVGAINTVYSKLFVYEL